MKFGEELKKQRWDDHRYYHHSRINQSLHLLSSVSFMSAYALLITSPQISAIIGWLVAMWSRQIGHFFFEPKDYDKVNDATHEYKEKIKVGYNLRRKVVLMGLWAASPFVLLLDPTFFGAFEYHETPADFLANLAIVWLVLGVAGLLFRTVQLFFISGVQTGLVWCTKILTDPFHDFRIYCKSPIYLLKGQLIDPMKQVADDRLERPQQSRV
ncbi:MAG: DUF962 domain-containing protein [Chromatiaceae bacterium]|nr:DUF962 domain-containing protein [Chromatiaceae bacterium]